jgi:hypothetical protein
LCFGVLGDQLHELLDPPVLPCPLLLLELVALWGQGFLAEKYKCLVTLVPYGILSYLINLVVPVGSATESPLALSGPLPATVSRG